MPPRRTACSAVVWLCRAVRRVGYVRIAKPSTNGFALPPHAPAAVKIAGPREEDKTMGTKPINGPLVITEEATPIADDIYRAA